MYVCMYLCMYCISMVWVPHMAVTCRLSSSRLRPSTWTPGSVVIYELWGKSGNVGKLWENHGRFMGKLWENHGRFMGKLWENHGRFMGKLWENHGRFMGKLWENHGRFMRKLWENHGRFMRNYGNWSWWPSRSAAAWRDSRCSQWCDTSCTAPAGIVRYLFLQRGFLLQSFKRLKKYHNIKHESNIIECLKWLRVPAQWHARLRFWRH